MNNLFPETRYGTEHNCTVVRKQGEGRIKVHLIIILCAVWRVLCSMHVRQRINICLAHICENRKTKMASLPLECKFVHCYETLSGDFNNKCWSTGLDTGEIIDMENSILKGQKIPVMIEL